jgi:hypothetical protein
MKRMIFVLVSVLCCSIWAQEEAQPTWKRTEPPAKPAFRIFHSDQTLNLPTASTIKKNEMQFEISHRFTDPISAKQDSYYGLDSHANIRIAFGYAVTDRFTLTAGRSNAFGNVDLRGKYRFFELQRDVPMAMAVQAGAGWNSLYQPPDGGHGSLKKDQMQYYGAVIFNALFAQRIAVGLSPSYLRNSDLFHPETRNTTWLGASVQVYLGHKFSVLAEYNRKLSGFSRGHDPAAFGIEMETFGHFFKLFVSNSVYLNPSTYLTGSDDPWASKYWHICFIITRLLKL